MKDPLFFSLAGLDVNDDAALEAFAEHVWESACVAFNKEQDSEDSATDNALRTQQVSGDSHGQQG